jgi:hypothetical protein
MSLRDFFGFGKKTDKPIVASDTLVSNLKMASSEEQKKIAGKILSKLRDKVSDEIKSKNKSADAYRLQTVDDNGGKFSIIPEYKDESGTYHGIGQVDVNLSDNDKELHYHKIYGNDYYFPIAQLDEFIGFVKQEMFRI